ncbi:hypothetical protein HUG17_4736 [Dermatophagoides farinae]|uniref:Uncharacterized protein n=1 Tax=Dermatophagoides farinae TaxID=6954 RepID=A0A9D4SHD2_DERFA|nr:hypothetical protein HUG17_4736 [Dermatophagoides farinae]
MKFFLKAYQKIDQFRDKNGSRKKLINNMMMALELVIAIIDDQLIALYHDKTMSLFPSVEQQQITYVKNNL